MRTHGSNVCAWLVAGLVIAAPVASVIGLFIHAVDWHTVFGAAVMLFTQHWAAWVLRSTYAALRAREAREHALPFVRDRCD